MEPPYPSALPAQLTHLGSRLGVVTILAQRIKVRVVVLTAAVQWGDVVDLCCLAQPSVALAFLTKPFVTPEDARPDLHPRRAASPLQL